VSRPKTLLLTLPDELLDLCEEHHPDPQTVLRGFIADLCGIRHWASDPRPDGLCSHGGDEREMAWAYFQHCGYGFFNRVGR
jgi:hypothetical protein